MRKLSFAMVALLISTVLFAQKPTADKISGKWESIDSDTKLRFEIFQSGERYFGKLLWASNMYEADGVTAKKDNKNPDKSLQNRSRKNIVNITNLKYENGEYTGGKLYNPDSGDTYSLKATLTSENELNFRGFMGVSLLGKTLKFKRITIND